MRVEKPWKREIDPVFLMWSLYSRLAALVRYKQLKCQKIKKERLTELSNIFWHQSPHYQLGVIKYFHICNCFNCCFIPPAWVWNIGDESVVQILAKWNWHDTKLDFNVYEHFCWHVPNLANSGFIPTVITQRTSSHITSHAAMRKKKKNPLETSCRPRTA